MAWALSAWLRKTRLVPALYPPCTRPVCRAHRWTDQRQYDFRCEAKLDVAVWKAACERAIANHWYG